MQSRLISPDRLSEVIIKTENAAKPVAQKSKYLCNYIMSLGRVTSALDYGCGKLRYFDEIKARCDRLTVVDSNIQLEREQVIHGEKTSVRDYLSRYSSVTCEDVDQYKKSKRRFDRAYCINVLSAIPELKERNRIIKSIYERLNSNGEALLVTQYRNSEFKKMQASPNAKKFADGFLIKYLRGYSFYGIIDPRALTKMATSAGFYITEQKLVDGSVYLRCATKAQG